MALKIMRHRRLAGILATTGGVLIACGCYNTPINTCLGPAPLRIPPACEKQGCCYEDSLNGGDVFAMYCGVCHNERSLAERPFSNYQNIAAHMRVRANFTGEEYAKLMEFLRRWDDVPPPVQDEPPSPKRFIYSQPIAELRGRQPATLPDLPAGPRSGSSSEFSPGQPPPGTGPQEGR